MGQISNHGVGFYTWWNSIWFVDFRSLSACEPKSKRKFEFQVLLPMEIWVQSHPIAVQKSSNSWVVFDFSFSQITTKLNKILGECTPIDCLVHCIFFLIFRFFFTVLKAFLRAAKVDFHKKKLQKPLFFFEPYLVH